MSFNLTVSPLTEREKKRLFGVFISHASADNDDTRTLAGKMRENGLNPVYDRDFLNGGQEFKPKILDYILCRAGVVLITPDSLKSDWVSYEIGAMASLGMSVYLLDTDNILAKKSNLRTRPYLLKYMPAYGSADALMETLKKSSDFSGLFTEETEKLSESMFIGRAEERVRYAMVKLESQMFDENRGLFDCCRFGTLITNFGMFYSGNTDGVSCAVSGKPIENRLCPYRDGSCALLGAKTLDESNYECVLLNSVVYNGKLFYKNDADPYSDDGRPFRSGTLLFAVPVHTMFGTEFKFIVDVADNDSFYKIMYIFEKNGFSPSASDNKTGGRIYLSLDTRSAQGFFRLSGCEFNNNYLCPGSLLRR